MSNQKQKFLPYLMWGCPLLFFAYQFILRLWPGLMVDQILHQLAIDAGGLGIIAAFYYAGYSGFQIPVAILLDRIPARYIIAVSSILCGFSILLFSYTDNWVLACLSRFMIGAGSATGFLATSKVVSEWFHKDRYATMVGFSFAIGLTGAAFGGEPINALIESYTWQNVVWALTFLSVAICLVTLAFLKRPSNAQGQEQQPFNIKDFKSLLSSPVIWLLGIANLLMVGSLEGFADVWGVPYLVTAYDFTKGEAAGLISFIFYGMIVGGPLLAFLSKRLGHYGVLSLCGVGMSVAFLLLLSKMIGGWVLLASLFFLVGVLCGYQVIIFATGSSLVPSHLFGVTIAFLNCINMVGGSFFHSVIGYMMNAFWTGSMDAQGVKLYTIESYTAALSIIPICSLLGVAFVAYVRYRAKRQSSEIAHSYS